MIIGKIPNLKIRFFKVVESVQFSGIKLSPGAVYIIRIGCMIDVKAFFIEINRTTTLDVTFYLDSTLWIVQYSSYY